MVVNIILSLETDSLRDVLICDIFTEVSVIKKLVTTILSINAEMVCAPNSTTVIHLEDKCFVHVW